MSAAVRLSNPCAYCHVAAGEICRSWCAHKTCTRCQRRTQSSGQLCRACYDERAKHTYWDRGEACRAKGPTKAECLLDVGHVGDHEGNGFDDWGPIGRVWWSPMTIAKTKERGR